MAAEQGCYLGQFAGVSLANMCANVTFLSVIVCLPGSVETLGSQQNGAKNYNITLRALLAPGLVCAPTMLAKRRLPAIVTQALGYSGFPPS